MLRKFISFLLSIVLLLGFTINYLTQSNLVFASTTSSNKELRSITLNDNRNLYIELGDTIKLDVKFNPIDATNKDVTFSSSDKDIVSVDKNGSIKALKMGSRVVITASVANIKASIYVSVYSNTDLKASFTEVDTVKDKIKTITINVSSKDTSFTSFYIYLPSGYMVEGTTASFPADRNGVYPFTVYDGSGQKRTFYHEIKGIKEINKSYNDIDDLNKSDFDIKLLYNNLALQYDYEKKQSIFTAELDKIRSVKLPSNSVVDTMEIKYYVPNLTNNKMANFTFDVEGKELKVKLLRQGEFYLMIIWQPSSDVRNVLTTYRAYNFASGQAIEVYPEMDYITQNGKYEILAESKSGLKELFNLNITDIDFMRPEATIALTYENKFELDLKDNIKLDYIITYDGKYVPIQNSKSNTEFEYKHPSEFIYNGEYSFICVDTSGNRTVSTVEIKNKRNVLYARTLGLHVHANPSVKTLFTNIGQEYEYDIDENIYYSNIFPSYMKGLSNTIFSPNGTITRAQMVAILCRINDLPYDISLKDKAKLSDISRHWAENYIGMAVSKRYIQGYKDKTFKPDSPLTRAEFAKMISNISTLKTKISSIPAVNNYSFTDITEQFVYAKVDILKLANRGVMTVQGNKFNPGAYVTRAEVIFAINKLYDLTTSADEFEQIENLYNKYYNFNDIKNNPHYKDIVISIIGLYREEK
jgi:hypothetical protein